MRRALAAAFLLLCGPAAAQPIQLYGTIGKAPVFLDLNRNGDTVSGWYLYLKAGKVIRLDGRLDHNGFFNLEEHTANTNTRSGAFSGRIKNTHWAGTWRNAAGRIRRDLSLDEVRGKLADVSGRYKCATKRSDRQFGYVYRQSLELTLESGRVKALKMARSEKGDDGDSQGCRIAMTDLKQVSSPVGILLRAKADTPDAPQHCTIRILKAGDYLVVRPGDASQSGDDCRGIADTMYCGPRSFWADLVVNRKTQMCKPVE